MGYKSKTRFRQHAKKWLTPANRINQRGSRQTCPHPNEWNIMAGLPRSERFGCLTERGIIHQAVAGHLTKVFWL